MGKRAGEKQAGWEQAGEVGRAGRSKEKTGAGGCAHRDSSGQEINSAHLWATPTSTCTQPSLLAHSLTQQLEIVLPMQEALLRP